MNANPVFAALLALSTLTAVGTTHAADPHSALFPPRASLARPALEAVNPQVDPTAELFRRLIFRPLNVVRAAPTAFDRQSIPDPFEHLRGWKVPILADDDPPVSNPFTPAPAK